MKSLVTGGAGFIGSNLVDRLIGLGHDVVVIDNESADCHEIFYWNTLSSNHKIDICNYNDIEPLFKDVDYVFHLASDARIQPSIANPERSIHTNSIGTFNVLEASRRNNVSLFVYASTSSSYGKNDIPNIELQKPDCLTPYSVAKVFGENLAKVYFNLYGLNTVALRYFNVYGDRQPLKGQYAPVIGLFLRQYFNDEPLTVVGDGKQRRAFTHIDDIIDAHVSIIDYKDTIKYGEVYNIGIPNNYSILEIAEHISSNIVFLEKRPGEVKETLPDISKFTSITSWNPQIDLLDWIDSQKDNRYD